MRRCLVFIFCALALAACLSVNMNQPTPTIDMPAVKTAAWATVVVQLTKDAAATPAPEPTSSFTPMPTVESEKVPGSLQSSLSVEALDPFGTHTIQRVTGWSYGFDSFKWVDSNILLLNAMMSPKSVTDGYWEPNFPAVYYLNSNIVWLPRLIEKAHTETNQIDHEVYWSAKLGVLIIAKVISSKDVVEIHNRYGVLNSTYPGKLLGVSPSRTKILLEDGTWIDLSTGNTPKFNWESNYEEFPSFTHPIWSSDETRVYTCCYLYGDAKTGKSFGIPYNQVSVDGDNLEGGLFHSHGTWVKNDSLFLVQWDMFNDSNPGFVPLFDPSAKIYRNLNKLTGIPTKFQGDPNCVETSAIPGGNYIWVECYSGNYLVDLNTFRAWTYPYFTVTDVQWSKDGKFALLSLSNSDSANQILSAPSHELKPLPQNDICSWHPNKDMLICLSSATQTLALIDAETLSVKGKTALSTTFREVVWSSDGKKIALRAADNSLWEIDYPWLDTLEQITPPVTNIKNIVWSPDSTFLGFISGTDIYIVRP